MNRFKGELFDEQGTSLGIVGGFYVVDEIPPREAHPGDQIGGILIAPGHRQVEEATHYIVLIDGISYLIFVRKFIEDGWKSGVINGIVRGQPDR